MSAKCSKDDYSLDKINAMSTLLPNYNMFKIDHHSSNKKSGEDRGLKLL
jgi:hypothetical protein